MNLLKELLKIDKALTPPPWNVPDKTPGCQQVDDAYGHEVLVTSGQPDYLQVGEALAVLRNLLPHIINALKPAQEQAKNFLLLTYDKHYNTVTKMVDDVAAIRDSLYISINEKKSPKERTVRKWMKEAQQGDVLQWGDHLLVCMRGHAKLDDKTDKLKIII
jgi:hypothetical protein